VCVRQIQLNKSAGYVHIQLHVGTLANMKLWQACQLVMAALWCQEVCQPQIVYQWYCDAKK